MFEPSPKPRVFGLRPGADFPAELAQGLLDKFQGRPPEDLARVTILVNTRRMQRRLKALMSDGPARLLPRIELVTDLDFLLPSAELPPSIGGLRRRLELAALVSALIQQNPDLAPRSAAVDLADSLASLMDEMQGEGVPPDRVLQLDTGDQSGHWDRSLKFIAIVQQYLQDTEGDWLDPEARRRLAAQLLIQAWQSNPPKDPIIVAGSTGSRATTALIMAAVSQLPQGAVVLPGFDFDLPETIFEALTDTSYSPLGSEDHPQYRFAKFASDLDIAKQDIQSWRINGDDNALNPLISLSLRPAPVTDQWLTEGPGLGDLLARTQNVTLIEAPHPKHEALGISIALRRAVHRGKTAALITPDRTLGRRVAAALQRWNIVPDDSAGRPLSLTAPGRVLRQVAGFIGKPADPVDLIALLKHPLVMTGAADRGPHLKLTRELELYVRKKQAAFINASLLGDFAKDRPTDDANWVDWLSDWIDRANAYPSPTLAACLDHHMALAEALCAGTADGSGALWEQTAGRDALKLIEHFRLNSDYSGPLPFAEYVRLLDRALSAESTRNYDTARPDVMIWGTLEARVQGADLVILGGLNEGTWPERPGADPWLNRPLRRQAGLLLPERQVGLSAHDYQQAVAAKEVILSRSRRDNDSETVPSRWLSRLTNLLDGLPDQNGPKALEDMRDRGQTYIAHATALDTPTTQIPPQPRPAPAPPRKVRPKNLSITEIQTLIRDPYAIYAKYILRLTPLDPLRVQPDARLRGIVFHAIIEDAFSLDANVSDPPSAAARLRSIAQDHLSKLPWPRTAALWYGHIDAIADRLAVEEHARRTTAAPIALERKGEFTLPGTPFAIRGKADRIDQTSDGRLVIYDYKTGQPPKEDQVRYYDRQLLIEAVMAEQGGFAETPAAEVARVVHIGLGRTPKQSDIELTQTDKHDFRTVTTAGELARLLQSFDRDAKGYPSRRAMEKVRYEGNYDHLARFGEWDETETPVPVPLP